jgi:hypothetical protein
MSGGTADGFGHLRSPLEFRRWLWTKELPAAPGAQESYRSVAAVPRAF